jgi:hypothetical protein
LTKQFQIKKICDHADRPAYSNKVDEYFEKFVYDNILTPFQIILDKEHTVILSVMILKRDETNVEGIGIYDSATVEGEDLVYYPVSIILEDVLDGGNVMENIVSLYFQVISLFFLTNYEVVSQEYMLSLNENIDWAYLLSIPYPAAYEDQKYVGDE